VRAAAGIPSGAPREDEGSALRSLCHDDAVQGCHGISSFRNSRAAEREWQRATPPPSRTVVGEEDPPAY
jgi:hypothetical protein